MTNKGSLRPDAVIDITKNFVEQMDHAGLNSPEALTVAELLLWNFPSQTMKLTRTPEEETVARTVCARLLARMAARVAAWPADTTQRM